MQTQTTPPQEPARLPLLDFRRPRIEAFRQEIAQAIPCSPDIRSDLLAKPLSTLLIDYMNWKDRFLALRSRTVHASQAFIDSGAYLEHMPALVMLKEKIEQGHDLTPYLSEKIAINGYIRPIVDQNGKRHGIEWEDKDYALNAYDTHHLHLGTRVQKNGKISRTRALLFANFTRDAANFFLIGDHKSFDDGKLARAVAEAKAEAGDVFKNVLPGEREMTAGERTQLHRRGVCTAMPIRGKLVQSAALSTAGTSLKHTMYAQHVMRSLQYWEPLLDTPETQIEWFSKIGIPPPEKPDFQWCMQHCDLGVFETSTKALFGALFWHR